MQNKTLKLYKSRRIKHATAGNLDCKILQLAMPGLYTMSQPAMGLEFWRMQVDKLHPKKQSSWKASCKDMQGTMHRIRFHNGYFQVKCTAKLIKENVPPIDGWAPIIACGTCPTEEQLQASYGHVLPKGVPELRVATNETAAIRAALDGCELEGLAYELFRADMLHELMQENLTGNHHRNHTIAVPTPAGQPVRG